MSGSRILSASRRCVPHAAGIIRHASVQAATQVCANPAKSRFGHVPRGPPDAILGITEAYNADTSPNKINLGVGAYRDADGRPFVLESVRKAERRLLERELPMEYLPVSGLADFVRKSMLFGFGSENEYVKNGCAAGIQTLSGTGACRVVGEFLSRFGTNADGSTPLVLVPKPTWTNHHAIFKDAGCKVDSYEYYNPDTKGVDIDACVASLEAAPSGSVVLLHATAHNPTGADPSLEGWKELSDVISRRGLIPFFDSAYQGFTSGDADVDAASVRMFVDDGHRVLLAQSYSKNMGLYGHRLGCMSVLTDSREEAEAIQSQLKILVRPIWSNPPLSGARIADEILGDNELEPLWRDEMKTMANRIKSMRTGLRTKLAAVGSEENWDHIVNQNGMFCFSGIDKECVARLAAEHSVYLTGNGRISMAGVYEDNMDYLANAIHQVTRK